VLVFLAHQPLTANDAPEEKGTGRLLKAKRLISFMRLFNSSEAVSAGGPVEACWIVEELLPSVRRLAMPAP